jgi:hypothetical protein
MALGGMPLELATSTVQCAKLHRFYLLTPDRSTPRLSGAAVLHTRITDVPVSVVLVNLRKPGQDSTTFPESKGLFPTSAHSCASAFSFHQSWRLCILMPPHHVTGASHKRCIFFLSAHLHMCTRTTLSHHACRC